MKIAKKDTEHSDDSKEAEVVSECQNDVAGVSISARI